MTSKKLNTPISGRRNPRSWEKQTFYSLSNGWEACVEYNPSYGEFIKRLDAPDGRFWCASDGLDCDYANDPCESIREVFAKHIPCPDWARAWLDAHRLVRPLFDRATPDARASIKG